MQAKMVEVDPGIDFCEGCHIFGNDELCEITFDGVAETKVLLCGECCHGMGATYEKCPPVPVSRTLANPLGLPVEFKTMGTVTGRFSAAQPNNANKPKSPDMCKCSECEEVFKVSKCDQEYGHHDGWEMPSSIHTLCPVCEDGGCIDDFFFSKENQNES